MSIKMAKDQGMVLNPTKVSGQCGRLKCCLVYEQATYAELRKGLPHLGKRVITPDGEGRGWQSEQTYRFTLTYTKARMEVAIDGDVIFTLTAAEAGGDLPTGRFGFYNYSQSRVRYGDFTVVRLD